MCNSCASLAGPDLCFIACFYLLLIAPLAPVLTSSYRRPTPGGASSGFDHSSSDIVPPPPSVSTPRDRMTSPASVRSAHLYNQPTPPAAVPDGALYSLPLDRVAVHVDADDNDDDVHAQHARSHSAPAAPRRRPATADHHHQHTGPPTSPPTWYLPSTSPREKKLDADRRLLPSPPPPPPSAASPTPCDSTTNVRCRRAFPPSDVELNGPVVADVASPLKRPNSASLPAVVSSCDPLISRRRLRAVRGGRLNQYSSGDWSLGSTLAGMAIVAVVALVFSAVGVQLLLRLTAASRRSATTHEHTTAQTTSVGDSLLPAATSKSDDSVGTVITRTVVEEITVALAAVTVALDLCCLLTLSMQSFLAVKLAHCRNAELRFDDTVVCSLTCLINATLQHYEQYIIPCLFSTTGG